MSSHLHLVCPACHGKNRVARADLQRSVHCGRCQTDLLAGQVSSLGDGHLAKFLAGTELPVLVDFWAPWCGPCRQMAPEFEKSAAADPMVRHVKVDTDANPAAASQFNIRSIPTLALFVAGQEVARTSGAMRAAELQRWVAQSLPPAG